MDTLLHALIAYTIILLIGLRKRISGRVTLMVIIGAIIPDMDYFFNIVGVQLDWLRHRGIAHSFFGVFLYVLPIALILYIPKIQKQLWHEPLDLHQIVLGTSVGSYIHLLSDMFIPSRAMFIAPLSFEQIRIVNYDLNSALITINIIVIMVLIICVKKIMNDFEVFTKTAYVLGILICTIFCAMLLWWAKINNGGTFHMVVLYINILSSFIIIQTILSVKLRKIIMETKKVEQ